ncbi:MAG: N-acetyl-gamma-glutamyl-phosphate reductase [Clostridia bacterium]|nr:N-acetyl-gamma-glutamyl-phosphate reductase [Clostridia bacterium]
MTKVFIDGSAGTTGLRIRERLSGRKDLELIVLPEETRKDPAARADVLNSAAVSFLCLPDAAAIEAASFVTDPDAVIIDTSTAHRVAEGWTYGMPELAGQREKLKAAKRIANPGCHATGFISLVAPLAAAGIIGRDVRLSCFSLTGYSGGGKRMIAEYESPDMDPLYQAPRQYGLGQAHKHLPEMAKVCGLDHAPVFCPIVAPYYAGMEVTVPLTPADTSASVEEIKEVYKAYYQGGLIRFAEGTDEGGFLSASAFAGRDDLEVSVFGNEERILLVSRFDNLGKGASGAAIQNMNLVLGLDEDTGLIK